MNASLVAVHGGPMRLYTLLALYGGPTHFQYEPYARQLAAGLAHVAGWTVRAVLATDCSDAGVFDAILDARLGPGDMLVWIGPFCRPARLWSVMRQRHRGVLLAYYNTEPAKRCSSVGPRTIARHCSIGARRS